MNQPSGSIKKILVPIAFSDNCEQARVYAFDLARQIGASVELFHVVEESPYATYLKQGYPRQEDVTAVETNLSMHRIEPEYLIRDLMEESRAELERIAVPSEGVRWEAKVATGHPAAEILKEIERLNPDLVVMATHQRSGLAHTLMGSVTEKVLRAAPVPVLALPMRLAA